MKTEKLDYILRGELAKLIHDYMILINRLRWQYIRHEIEICTDVRKRWSAITRLLSSPDNDGHLAKADEKKMCTDFSLFLSEKIQKLRDAIKTRLLKPTLPPPFPDPPHNRSSS